LNNKITFVNYYPCSFGDSIVAMFNNQPLKLNSTNSSGSNMGILKQIKFYEMNIAAQQQELDNLLSLKNQAYAGHRQNRLDYTTFNQDFQVVTIIIDEFLDKIIKRFQEIHKYKIENPVISKILDKNPTLATQTLIVDYTNWAKNNILDSDILLKLSVMLNKNEMQEWCRANQLNFNVDYIDNIIGRFNDTN